MENTYTINITNKSNDDKKYFIFTELPQVNNVDTADLFANVFQVSDYTPPEAQAQFQIDRTVLAVCLTSKSTLPGTKVTTSGKQRVKVATTDSAGSVVKVDYDQKRKFATLRAPVDASAPNDPEGGFVIETNSFEYPTENNFCVGVGTVDNGAIVPIYIFKAKPDMVYNMYPIVKYYIMTGDYQPGQILDYQVFQKKAKLVQFKAGKTTINLTQNANNSYTETQS